VANFALLGAAGFIARRHLEAIYISGHKLLVACDPHDSVGVMDSYFPNALFYTDPNVFALHMANNVRADPESRVDYCAICSPTYLHADHIALALRSCAHAICEKPLVLQPEDLIEIQEIEKCTGRRTFAVLQLRYHPALIELRKSLASRGLRHTYRVAVHYVAPRGEWYHVSWKGDPNKSGGLALNIGVHLFDVLLWLFGSAQGAGIHLSEPRRLAGTLVLQSAIVNWLISVDPADLPDDQRTAPYGTIRRITVDGCDLDFSDIRDLHLMAYEHILAGNGITVREASASIELVKRLGALPITPYNPTIEGPDQC